MKASAPLLCVIAALLVGCTLAVSPTSVQVTVEAPTTQPDSAPTLVATETNLATPTVRPSYTPRPTQTSSPTPLPIATFPYPADYASDIPQLDISGSVELHDLIIFQNESGSFPFNYTRIGSGDVDYSGPLKFRYCGYGLNCLYGVSPDGKRAGLISPDDFDFAMALQPNGVPVFVENGFVINQPEVQTVQLPDICSQDASSDIDERCDQIQLSQDGRYLAFRYGIDNCGRSMQLIDNQTGEVIYEKGPGIHFIRFQPNGVLEIDSGHCQGSFTNFFDLKAHRLVRGGSVGRTLWNQAHSIFVVSENGWMSGISNVWGYRLDSGTTFYPEGESNYSIDEHVIFLGDDRRFIYQHLAVGIEKDGMTNVIDTPAQIVRYDPIAGQRTVLASDPNFHFRLCQFDREDPCPLQWYGDWIQVQRVPFALVYPEGFNWSSWDDSSLSCMAEGKACDKPPESFALNAHTGEMKPWDPASLPLAYPTPTPTPGPNLLGQPIYADPDGQFTLNLGSDGKSLWMVPRKGPAVKWITQGKNFVYLP